MADGRTRLVISGYQAFRPRWIELFVTSWLYIPVVWIMQARMLAVLKRSIERAAEATWRPPDDSRAASGSPALGDRRAIP
jgi:hypothetical protein